MPNGAPRTVVIITIGTKPDGSLQAIKIADGSNTEKAIIIPLKRGLIVKLLLAIKNPITTRIKSGEISVPGQTHYYHGR